jgi:hypothetical protein
MGLMTLAFRVGCVLFIGFVLAVWASQIALAVLLSGVRL